MSVRKGRDGIKKPFSKTKIFRRSCKVNLSYRKYIFYSCTLSERKIQMSLFAKKCVYDTPFWPHIEELIISKYQDVMKWHAISV